MRAALVVFLAVGVAQVFRPALADDVSPARGAAAAPVSRIVRIDVFASDARGRLVETLKPSDFEVTEDGALHPVDTLRFIKTDGREPGGDAQLTPIRSEFD